MRVLVVNGAPRKQGYTSELVDLFTAGVSSGGGEFQIVSLREKHISPCNGCFKCWVGEQKGRCVLKDDMAMLLKMYLSSDIVVLASPVYYFGFSALIKIFLERLFPTLRPGLDMGGVLGLGRNKLRWPDRGPKKGVLIATCALRNPQTLTPLEATFNLVCDAMGALPVGKLLRTESNLLDFEQSKPRTLRRVRRAIEKAGSELVRNGEISKKTEEQAALPVTASSEVFASHFETYWEIANEMGSKWRDRIELASVANQDPRIVMRELASYYNPGVSEDLAAVIQFDLTDSDTWQLVIKDGACQAVQGGQHDKVDLTLSMSRSVFNDMMLQRISAQSALARKLIVTKGSTALLARFARLFPRPVD